VSCRIARQVYDDRYGYPGRFELIGCDDCGHEFLNEKFPAETLRDLYSNYYPRSYLDLESHRPYEEANGFGAWLAGEGASPFRWVPRDVRVLDIGCGFGESLGYYRSRGCDAYGVEADENIRRVADRFDYKVHVGLFDASVYEPHYFDFVTMGQVIEHVDDPIETLRGVARVLKPGGRAILSTPNSKGLGARLFGGRWAHWHAPYHLQFFSRRSMELSAQQAGLVLEDSRTVTPSAWLVFQWMHLMTRPREGRRSDFWVHTGEISRHQRTASRIASLASRLKINDLITRAADFLNMGDNRLFFLRKA
jgi:SAM-dependent methyltransferase